jgi:hypothetical protein
VNTARVTSPWLARLCTLLIALSLIVPAAPAYADPKFCFCGSDLTQLKEGEDLADRSLFKAGCLAQPMEPEKCEPIFKQLFTNVKYLSCKNTLETQKQCQDAFTTWNKEYEQTYKQLQQSDFATVANNDSSGGFIGRIVPQCLLQDKLSSSCRDISVLVALIINYGKSSLGIVGAFALCYFIYGGFILILSAGNPESVKKGTDTMLAALIGLFIVFVSYLLIKFLGTSLGIKEQFQLF